VVKEQHQLLVTLLLCNAAAMEILDYNLGHNDSALFWRAQLKALVSIHGKEGKKLTNQISSAVPG
jgi:hypothetical protein